MKIKKVTPQIAAMYLGQKCDVEWLVDADFAGISKGETWHNELISTSHLKWLYDEVIKITPHLRRLESITEEEARELFQIVRCEHWLESASIWGMRKDEINSCLEYWWNASDEGAFPVQFFLIGSPVAWMHLLSKGFDLFNLIESGLAKEVTP